MSRAKLEGEVILLTQRQVAPPGFKRKIIPREATKFYQEKKKGWELQHGNSALAGCHQRAV